MELFKYVTSDRIDILQNGLIRFTQPKALNDPFDTQPSIDEIFSQTYLNKIFGKQIFPEELLKFFNVSAKTLPLQFFEENIGILSLAENSITCSCGRIMQNIIKDSSFILILTIIFFDSF